MRNTKYHKIFRFLFTCILFASVSTKVVGQTDPLALICYVHWTIDGKPDERTDHIQFGPGGIAYAFTTGYEQNIHQYRYQATSSVFILDWLDHPSAVTYARTTINRETGSYFDRMIIYVGNDQEETTESGKCDIEKIKGLT
jgi:hypothetical protein